ncbi:MAG: ATP-binding protein [Eubacteriales bacterium]
MEKRIFIFTVMIVLVSSLVSSLTLLSLNKINYQKEMEDKLTGYCKIINRVVENELKLAKTPDYIKLALDFSKDISGRITFIDATGKVIADSSIAFDQLYKLENHANRQEVKQALQNGIGISLRKSDTLGQDYLYVAMPFKYNKQIYGVTRIAFEATVINKMDAAFIKIILISLLLGLIIGGIFSYYYSIWITRPINKKGKELENIRKEFVANVSHELKTPLTSISGYIETLQSGAIDKPEVRDKFLDIIAIETSRLNRLIEDLLIISDIESGRVAKTPERINVKESINDTIEFLHNIAESKKIKLATSFEDGDIYINGSHDRFKQMMINLLENAIKYSNENTKVEIDLYCLRDMVVIKVKDEGIGIAKEHIPRLFERFYRVDKSRSQKVGGTGLGLAIVKHIVFLFEGEINVKSMEGIGSTFTVTIPREKL